MATTKRRGTEAAQATTGWRTLDGGAPICYAHRGARASLPENTLAAFALGLELGAEGIECDVQRTRDGELIILHDGTLDRTTNGTGLVSATPFSVVRELNAGVRDGMQLRVPTLAETLALVRERGAQLNLEIKGESVAESVGTAEAVEPVLRSLAHDTAFCERLLVSSFELPAVRLLKEHLPWLRTAALFTGSAWREPRTPTSDRSDMVAVALDMRAEAIHPPLTVDTPGLIRRAHEAGLRVNVWTVNRVPSIRRLLALGVDGLFSDYPERVVIARARMATLAGGVGG